LLGSKVLTKMGSDPFSEMGSDTFSKKGSDPFSADPFSAAPLSGDPVSVPFVLLRVHPEYLLIDSVVRVGPLMKAVEKLGMPAVAVTDQGNLSAMVKVYKAALARGIKPIIGADVWTADSHDDRDPHR